MSKTERMTLADTIAQDILGHNTSDCASEDKAEMCNICVVVTKLETNINKLKTETCIYCPTTAPEYECPICRERHAGMSHIQMLFLHSYADPYRIQSLAQIHKFTGRSSGRSTHTTILDFVVISCNPHINGKKLPNMPLSANGDINIETINNNTGGLIGKLKANLPFFGGYK